MKWYEVDEKERVKKFYSQYSIKKFWDWWSNGNPQYMEVRIKDYALIKQVVNKYKIPYSVSGVYVTTAQELKAVISFVREKATIWFGINPRKKNWGSGKWKSFGSGQRGGSSDDNVVSIDYLFVDVDRKLKIKPANNNELKNCDILAEKIIERMVLQKWSESYIKIASGNGLQLLFKLDFPIKIPARTYNKEKKYFEFSEEFDKLKRLIKDGIGSNIRRFGKRFEDELMVDVDASAFNVTRVGSLPVTKNYKFDSFQWRGIVEMKDGVNNGLSDYILSKMTDLKTFKSKNVFVKSLGINYKSRIRKGELRKHPIAKLFMDNDLPFGELNNKLWFQLKVLLRDSRFDSNTDEFREFHRDLEKKYNGRFTTNYPTANFDFSEDVVNSYCINNCILPIYKLWGKRNSKQFFKLEEMKWGVQNQSSEVIELDSITTIQEDMKFVKDKLTEGDYKNIIIIAAFINGCIKKYGEKKAKFFVDNLFDRFFNYS